MNKTETIYSAMTLRARWTFLAHLFKACCKQHHKALRKDFALIVPPNGIVLDVGAHSGQYTKLLAGIADRGHIWAIEPSSYAYTILSRAIAFNRLQNVTAVRSGLGDTVGDAVLQMPVKNSGSLGFGLSHLGSPRRDRTHVHESVPMTTIDQFVTDRNIAHVDLIKADIEGWELRLLHGAEKTIDQHQPVLYLELVDAFLTSAGDSVAGAWQFLLSRGFAGFQFTGKGELLACEVGAEGDLVFLPVGHPIRRD